MTVKLLTEHHLEFLSLIGGFTGSSESALVKMPYMSWLRYFGLKIDVVFYFYFFFILGYIFPRLFSV